MKPSKTPILEGKFERLKKTTGGHDRIWVEEPSITILYARVSSSKPKSSLVKQEELLRKKYPDARFISDVASGFNQNRRGDRTILERALDGNPLYLVATTSDRVTRSGFALIKWIIELSGGRIEFLEEPDTWEQFETKTLIAFVTRFINSYYSKRSASLYHRQEDKDLPWKWTSLVCFFKSLSSGL